jgi:gluconolactonase
MLDCSRRVGLALFGCCTLGCTGSSPAPSTPAAAAAEEHVPEAAQRAAMPPRTELPPFCAGAASASLPATAKAKLIKDGFVFLEGALWSDQLGAFLFSEMDFGKQGPNGPPSTIHELRLPSTFEVFIEDAGSNGLAIDAEGLVAATHDTQTLSRYDLKTRARSVYAKDVDGKHFNSPNDVTLHSRGHAYFTDPDWQIGERKNETGVTGVYWRKPDGTVALIDGSLNKPNGIALSPDETKLYVNAFDGRIGVYPLNDDGSAGPRQEFAQIAPEPDGMGVDCAGNLYVSSHPAGKVHVLNPAGAEISVIEVAPKTTNIAFGGADHKTIFITAGGGVYSLQSPVAGFPY